MREILFRGKRVDNGEWVYGVPTIESRGETVIVENVFDCEEYNCRGVSCLYVEENTVGQYTGLTDKNGKKIFEGDIVTAHFKNNRHKQTFEVSFLDGMFIFDNRCVKVNLLDIFCIEIIGNIHDNPELLEDKQ